MLKIHPNLVVISGGASGIDSFAEIAAKSLGVPVAVHRPDIPRGLQRHEVVQRYYDRNKAIVDDSDEIHAFVSQSRKGGTENTISHANKASKPVTVHPPLVLP